MHSNRFQQRLQRLRQYRSIRQISHGRIEGNATTNKQGPSVTNGALPAFAVSSGAGKLTNLANEQAIVSQHGAKDTDPKGSIPNRVRVVRKESNATRHAQNASPW